MKPSRPREARGGGPARPAPGSFLLLFVGLAALAACNRPSGGEPTTAAPLLEVRDPQGQPVFALEEAGPGRFAYRQAGAGAGLVQAQPAGRYRGEAPGQGPLEVWRLEGGEVELRGPEGLRLRLTREGPAWRLGDGAGIPVARLRREAAEAVAHDAGGLLVLRARAAGGRLVISGREGETRAFVLGEVSLEAAALAAWPALAPADRALLLLAIILAPSGQAERR